MNHHWDLATGSWNIPWPGRISQHDLVYLSPPDDPMEGLPIGNGDLGAMLWTDGSVIHLAINKVDTWDDGPAADFHNWEEPAAEDHQTTLRGCARLTLDLGLPLLETAYLQDFHGGLRLTDATAHLDARSPLGEVRLSAFVERGHRSLVVRLDTATPEPVEQAATLARFGSRSYGHWFAVVNRDPSIGLAGTETATENGRVVIRQQLRTLRFVVAMELVADRPTEATTRRYHSRAAGYAMQAASVRGYTLFVTVVTSEEAEDPEVEAHARLDGAVEVGLAALAARHADDWKGLWMRTLVELPDRYLANIWYLSLYFAASSSRGSSPPHFSRGLWATNRDFMPWYFYFHWNTQWATWPLHPADAAELADPYLRYRFDQLPRAIDFAKTRGFDGALYVDVADRRGFQDLDADGNHTPGPQIAMDFWRHYEYTGDIAFLRTRAYPVMKAVGEWYLGTITTDLAGQHHAMSGTAYESFLLMEDSITDLAMIRALLPALAEAARVLGSDAIDRSRLLEIVDRLAGFHLVPLRADETVARDGQRVHAAGLGRGRPVESSDVLAAGFDPATKRWMRYRIAGQDAGYYGIPDPEFAPVFPAGVLGLEHRDSAVFRAMVTQLRLHPYGMESYVDPAVPSYAGGDGLCMGWCPAPIVAARLGLGDETLAAMRDHVQLWQQFPQGFGHYGPYSITKRDRNQFHFAHQVRDASAPGDPVAIEQPNDPARRDADSFDHTLQLASWPFRHSTNEAVPIVATAISEMLLQSHEGVIRICPAVPTDWDVAFTLVARGGFKVTAERQGGRVTFVHLECRTSHRLVMENPWPDVDHVFVWEDGRASPIVEPTDRSRIVLETRAGGSYLIATDEALVADWVTVTRVVATNERPKRLGPALLGKERRF